MSRGKDSSGWDVKHGNDQDTRKDGNRNNITTTRHDTTVGQRQAGRQVVSDRQTAAAWWRGAGRIGFGRHATDRRPVEAANTGSDDEHGEQECQGSCLGVCWRVFHGDSQSEARAQLFQDPCPAQAFARGSTHIILAARMDTSPHELEDQTRQTSLLAAPVVAICARGTAPTRPVSLLLIRRYSNTCMRRRIGKCASVCIGGDPAHPGH